MPMVKKKKNKNTASEKEKPKAKKKQVLKIIPPVVSENAIPAPAVEPLAIAKGSLWSWIKPVLFGTIFTAVVLLVVGGGIFWGVESYYHNRTLPNTYVGSIPVGGLKYDQAEKVIKDSYQSLAQKQLTIVVDGKPYQIGFMEAGISFDFDRVMHDLRSHGRHDVWATMVWPNHIIHGMVVDKSMLIHALQKNIPDIAVLPKDAQVTIAQDAKGKSYFAVQPAEMHTTIDFDQVNDSVFAMLQRGDLLPVVATSFLGQPTITDAKAYQAVSEAELWLKNKVTVGYVHHAKRFTTEIAPSKDWQWISFIPTKDKLAVALAADKWEELMKAKAVPAIEQVRQNVTVALPEKGSRYAVVSGQVSDGYTVEREKSKDLVTQALSSTGSVNAQVELVVDYQPGEFVSSDGRDLGLKDLLGTGYSKFVGSSNARIFNVKKGLDIFNNIILAPGETLSFNSMLGDVTVAAGWKEELVIKEGGKKTVPEAGGGLCQVSTTTYRALIESGLEVSERRAHSYLVSYYVGDNDPRSGIDATIYPGSQDLVFKNDTSNYILFQTDITATEAFVRIYGTSDGRAVKLEGPIKSGYVSPGSAILVPTTDLPAGKTKITKAAHNGRTVRWEQYITYADGRVEKNDIISVYKAIPAEGLIGVAAASPADSLPEGTIAL
jgi:vancomycin resistance protein YoaR